VTKPVFVVALGEVTAGVGAAGLLSSQGARHRYLRQVEQIFELEGVEEIRVVSATLVPHRRPLGSALDLPDGVQCRGEPFAGPVDSNMLVHDAAQLTTQVVEVLISLSAQKSLHMPANGVRGARGQLSGCGESLERLADLAAGDGAPDQAFSG
jgi:hypothetical protein